MSRQELANLVEINVQTVGFIERGNYGPSLELAFKIARVFDLPIETIFSDKLFPSVFKPNNNKE